MEIFEPKFSMLVFWLLLQNYEESIKPWEQHLERRTQQTCCQKLEFEKWSGACWEALFATFYFLNKTLIFEAFSSLCESTTTQLWKAKIKKKKKNDRHDVLSSSRRCNSRSGLEKTSGGRWCVVRYLLPIESWLFSKDIDFRISEEK